MVFRKRGGLLPNEKWTYNGHAIETVNDFNYLGVVFNYTGSFNLNQEHLIGKALKALNTLFCKCQEFDLKPKILCQLFDAFVGSILGYSSEVWGFTKSKELERIHLKFCKRLLRVKTNTCNACVYGELGRYPLFIHRYMRIVQYWFKIAASDNIIIKTVYNIGVSDYARGCRNWIYNIKKLLDDYGFSYVFNSVHDIDFKFFKPIIKSRIIDSYKQNWHRTLEDSSMLDIYRTFKSNLEYEIYLDLVPKHLRFYLCRLRLSVHPLRIQTGRYNGNTIARQERYCLCCNTTDIEDEFHFVCICSTFVDLRKKYIKKYYYNNPSVIKYVFATINQ